MQTLLSANSFERSGSVQIAGDSMALSHELSSEIAAALFAAKDRSPRELRDLKEILLVIHSTLQQLSDDAHLARMARVERINSQFAPAPIAKGGFAR